MIPRTTRFFRLLALLCCVAILVLTSAEVLLRALGFQFFLSYEYSGFLLGALVFFALPAITYAEDHISVLAADPEAADPISTVRRAASRLVTVVYLCLMTYVCGLVALGSFRDGSRSQGIMLTPLYIPQTSMVIGLAIAVVVLTVKLVRDRRLPRDGEQR